MKRLIIKAITSFSLLLWAIDMVFPWQQWQFTQQNRYQQILKKGKLTVGTLYGPTTYFIGVNGKTGLEYELSQAFADYLGVELEMIPYENNDKLFNALNNCEIDIAGAGLFFEPDKMSLFQIGPAYYSASWQVAYRKGTLRPRSIKDLKGTLTVASHWGSHFLLEQKKQQYPNLNWQHNDIYTPEQLLLQVADSKLDYTVANSVEIAATQQISPDIAVGFDLTDESSIHWYLAKSSYNELQGALLDFMNQAMETGLLSRIEDKYFNHFRFFDYVDTRSYLRAIERTLPTYIPLFQKYSGNLDWRLLAAIAYQESHWNANATSPTGVRGMMMLTKATADRMNVTDRTNAEQSIRAGSEYLQLLLAQMPKSIVKEDRIWFALAAYNMGLGHLLDVRRLTKKLGGDPDNWLTVKKNLPLLADKRYYPSLKYGYARGYEAYQYIENIQRYKNSLLNYYRIQTNEENRFSAKSSSLSHP